MFVFNFSQHRSTRRQPYQLLYGRTLKIPSACTRPKEPVYNYEDYHFELKQRLQAAHAIAHDKLVQQKWKTKTEYDKTMNKIEFHVGDQVLLQDKARKGKFSAKWLGPYQVLEHNHNENVTIQKGRRRVKVHSQN